MFANTRTDPFWSFWPHSCILAPCVCVSRTLLRCSTLPGSGSRGIRPNLLAQQCMSVSFVCLDAWMQHCAVGVLLLNHDQRALHSPAHPAHPAYPTYSWERIFLTVTKSFSPGADLSHSHQIFFTGSGSFSQSPNLFHSHTFLFHVLTVLIPALSFPQLGQHRVAAVSFGAGGRRHATPGQ